MMTRKKERKKNESEEEVSLHLTSNVLPLCLGLLLVDAVPMSANIGSVFKISDHHRSSFIDTHKPFLKVSHVSPCLSHPKILKHHLE